MTAQCTGSMVLSHLIVAAEQVSTEMLQYRLIMFMHVGLLHELYVVSKVFYILALNIIQIWICWGIHRVGCSAAV